MARYTTHVTRWTNPQGITLVVGTKQRSQAERAYLATGLGVSAKGMYQEIEKNADEDYKGIGAEQALENMGQVYRVDGDTVTPVLRLDDKIAQFQVHAANALTALDAGDLDALRTHLEAMAAGAPAAVQITPAAEAQPVQEQQAEEPAAEYEPTALEIEVLGQVAAGESLAAEEIGAEGDIESALRNLVEKGLLMEDGHNSKGAQSYAVAMTVEDAA
jgi:hypothetical protein